MLPINVAQHVQDEQQGGIMSDSNMVEIKLKKGSWEIEISCREDKVKEVIENVLAGMDGVFATKETPNTLSSDFLTSISERKQQQQRSSKTCKVLIESLWKESWFSIERSLADVHEELSRRGYNYDRTAVSHSLTDLVRENILTRTGTMRTYRYIQKRPSED